MAGTTELGNGDDGLKAGTTELGNGDDGLKAGTTELGNGDDGLKAGTTELGNGDDGLKAGTTELGNGDDGLKAGTTELGNGDDFISSLLSSFICLQKNFFLKSTLLTSLAWLQRESAGREGGGDGGYIVNTGIVWRETNSWREVPGIPSSRTLRYY
ncbi:hypothetical protein BgiBS90_017149 [Biomphalaria glabrata]|nr:hypothetical protein BgiBS90_017149 [Biomphalaria glabrata]